MQTLFQSDNPPPTQLMRPQSIACTVTLTTYLQRRCRNSRAAWFKVHERSNK